MSAEFENFVEQVDTACSDDEYQQKAVMTAERLAEYNAKKANKTGSVAMSNIIFDFKPCADTINVNDIETAVRAIAMDGLVWGGAKILPVGFGINTLQISCVVEDEKVSTDALEDYIANLDELVQSVDVIAFNKV
ncbi:hypothetical protein PENTCL1PPCAC_9526 [Pristionchus entomophagus]|uniref:Translation elongation factor EF1B beta/delta subunit guanine nucleotide exchange domain-containing protein n=1 Tax=Pristionchus entomophagus TaxID=358040 RepID=A0AAV5T6M5_9BILA|nr:hypothetical protein PENTCL1PPCAC_9526 [Pristionchus entomophagus]